MSPEPEKKSGLSLTTLLISSLSAVAAAIIVPTFWERGSLIATAVTPIVVALVSEALNRPAKVITEATPRVARRSATGAAVRTQQPTGVGARGEGPERVSRWGTRDDPFGLRTPAERPKRRLPLKLAIGTGLIAAVIGAGVVTASELAIFGHSVTGSDRSTSVFGGRESPRDEEETPTPTATSEPTGTASPEATATATEAPTEAPTVTPTATVSPAPTATTTPPAAGATPAPTP